MGHFSGSMGVAPQSSSLEFDRRRWAILGSGRDWGKDEKGMGHGHGEI